MVYLIYSNGVLEFDNQQFSIGEMILDSDGVRVNCQNENNYFWTIFIANETTINSVLQTSSDMILQTLSA